MSWMGKILGGSLGFMVGGPIGAVLGAVAGHHAFDAGDGVGTFSVLENKQSIYFVATFSMLGKLAKADGAVTQQEIDVIDRVMRDNLRLNAKARSFAIDVFNTAKDSSDHFEDFAQQFYDEFGNSTEVLASVIDLLLLVGFADQALHPAEEELILKAVRIFRLENQYQQIKSRFVGVPEDINKHYAILGAKRGDDIKEIKKKYRKLAMEHHPDRIQSKGVPRELAAAAEERFKEIQHAFDLVEEDANGS
ncbi:MAG TPA: TerB family tellurite resistance protein [Pseudomonadales bacterium]|nr:TerB family tellurite resistance protein [Pseudomonadales bacterium]